MIKVLEREFDHVPLQRNPVTPEEEAQARLMLREGRSNCYVARWTGISASTVSDIRLGRGPRLLREQQDNSTKEEQQEMDERIKAFKQQRLQKMRLQ
jgi:uncharacterized protein (UPF0305 family)